MSNEDDTDGDVLAPVNLHAWRVPPPAALDHASLLTRALSPTARPRLTWMLVASAVANVVLAAILVVVLVRPRPQVAVQAPGVGPVDAQAKEPKRSLEQERAHAEEQLRHLEQEMLELERERNAHPVRDEQWVRPTPTPTKTEPSHNDITPTGPPCDEVSCVLNNYAGACCSKFHKRTVDEIPESPPERLDRDMIDAGMNLVRDGISTCGDTTMAHGTVAVLVDVSPGGKVDHVDVDKTPNLALDVCITAFIRKAHFARTQHGGTFTYPVSY